MEQFLFLGLLPKSRHNIWWKNFKEVIEGFSANLTMLDRTIEKEREKERERERERETKKTTGRTNDLRFSKIDQDRK